MKRGLGLVALLVAVPLLGDCSGCTDAAGPTVDGDGAYGVVKVDDVPRAGVTVQSIHQQDGSVRATTITDAQGRYGIGLSIDLVTIVRIIPPPNTHCPVVEARTGSGDVNKTRDFECWTTFEATMTGSYTHTTGIVGVSFDCKLIRTAPARPGATYSLTATGPTQGGASGVVSPGPLTGTLDGQGEARINVHINRFGTYLNAVTITAPHGIVRTVTTEVTVTSAPGSCP